MGWGEVLKELLKSFSQLIRDIPVWAKVVLAFGIFCLVAIGVIVNLDQLIVYDVEIIETPNSGASGLFNISYETTQRETKTDESGRVKLVLATGLLDRQENVIVVKKPAVNLGEEPPRVRYGFTSKLWRSQMVSFTLTCDFKKKHCELEKAGQFQDIQVTSTGIPWLRGLEMIRQAYAQPREPTQPSPPKTLVTPTIQTLMRVAPDGGYTEFRFAKLSIDPSYCKKVGPCPDTLFAEIEWNGIRLLFDGIEAAASRERNLVLTEEGYIRGDLLFAVENTLFGGGANSLKVSVYSRGGVRAAQQKAAPQVKAPAKPLDVLQSSVAFLRSPENPVKGQLGLLTATVETRTVRDQLGRSYEVFVGAGTYAQAITKQEFINTKLALSFAGQPVVGTIRPPLPGKSNWGVALGVRDPVTGRVRILFSKEEADRLNTDLKRLPSTKLGPLKRDEFFVYKLREVL
jgi:hypothetical protein